MGPKRTQYETCRKTLNAFALVESFGELGNDLRKVRYDIENEFSTVQSDVTDARRRFEKARARQSDLHRWTHDVLWTSAEQEALETLAQKASAELIRAEAEWNDI